MMTDPTHGIHEARRQPETDLILAVLGRAILDLFGSVGLTSNDTEKDNARRDAFFFLTEKTGPWARRRRDLCDAVGIDGDDMRDRVVRVLDGDALALDAYEARSLLTHIGEARALWIAHNAPKPARRTRTKPAPTTQPRAKVGKYADVRAALMPLLNRPMTFKDLVLATNGDLSDTVMRDVLRTAIAKGEIVQDPKTWEYRTAPHKAVAEAAA
ncbi:MAG: hypothetical protein CSA68_11630 [Rhodobacterales bacterium]|nr:MAG: hypothetical protein CSA68_11630 [Rhodobacterales bacterium]